MATTSIAHGITEFTNANALARETGVNYSEEEFVSTPICAASIITISVSVDNTFDHGC